MGAYEHAGYADRDEGDWDEPPSPVAVEPSKKKSRVQNELPQKPAVLITDMLKKHVNKPPTSTTAAASTAPSSTATDDIAELANADPFAMPFDAPTNTFSFPTNITPQSFPSVKEETEPQPRILPSPDLTSTPTAAATSTPFTTTTAPSAASTTTSSSPVTSSTSTAPRLSTETTTKEKKEKKPSVGGKDMDFPVDDALLAALEDDDAGQPPPPQPRQTPVVMADADFKPIQQKKRGQEVDAKLPLENGGLYVFWLDACEDTNLNSWVYLFGKVQTPSGFASCSITVKTMERVLYAVPRLKEGSQPASLEDLFHEFEEVSSVYNIPTMRAKPCKKNYAFYEAGVPIGVTEYLKIKVPSSAPLLPQDISGRTFSRIYGTHTSLVEHIILKCRLQGPEWLFLHGAEPNSVKHTWATYEVVVKSVKDIFRASELPSAKPRPSPPLTLLSLSLQIGPTIANQKKKQPRSEIIVVSGVSSNQFAMDSAAPTQSYSYFTLLNQIRSIPTAFSAKSNSQGVIICRTERELLSSFISKVTEIDPDVIVGHRLLSFIMDMILSGFAARDTPQWSILGRMRRNNLPRTGHGDWASKNLLCGRLACDTYLLSKEFLRSQKNYELSDLALSQFQMERVEIRPEDVPAMFGNASQLQALVSHTLDDAKLALNIVRKLMVIPLTKQLTNIAGNLWSQSLFGHRAERIEYLLLHRFSVQDFVLPDKFKAAKNQFKKKKGAYSGGLVLEPQSGFYDKIVLLLDFKSLYPSLIQEHNICFTTVNQVHKPDGTWEATPPDPSVPIGILPQVVRMLVEKRRQVKDLMKNQRDKAQLEQLDIRQSALKLIANSLYGCLGFPSSRFYAKPIAELITCKGRETLQQSVTYVSEKHHLNVIYGDTDSMMISTNVSTVEEAWSTAREITKAINKNYHTLEIEVDGVFHSILLLKKKKYAALRALEGGARRCEVKGLDMVRRDWCDLAHKACRQVLDFIMSGQPLEEVAKLVLSYLSELSVKIREGNMPLTDYVITRALTKKVEEYPDAKSLPHVLLAKHLISQGKTVRVGDLIGFIISSGDQSFAERARSLEQVESDHIPIDVEYYLAQQVLPTVCRLLEPVSAISSSSIADSLGLDPIKYARFSRQGSHTAAADHRDDINSASSIAAPSSHTTSSPLPSGLLIYCPSPSCHRNGPAKFLGLAAVVAHLETPAASQTATGPRKHNAFMCPQCNLPYTAGLISNQLQLAVRSFTKQYYYHSMICTAPLCAKSSRLLVCKEGGASPRPILCSVPGCKSPMAPFFSEEEFVKQLQELRSLFDLDSFLEANPKLKATTVLSDSEIELCRVLYQKAQDHISQLQQSFLPAGLYTDMV
ncbi:DNA-directed DNA polymerase [Pelomyxa schiedti]|nr:DNA-directed DNA polymerase [Pelomyxa schiedti]